MFKRTFKLLQVLSVLLALAAPGRADQILLTWTGTTFFDALDNAGVFGPEGALVPGGSFYTATYLFDTSIGFTENEINSSQQVEGGSSLVNTPPIPLVSATMTVNGGTADINGDYYSLYFRQGGSGALQSTMICLAQREIDGNPVLFGGELFQRVSRPDDSWPLSLDQPGEFDFTPAENLNSNFLFIELDNQGNIAATTGFGLIPSHLSITSMSVLLGDVNLDGVVNLLDVAPFVTAITSGTFIPQADINDDGVVNLLDVAPFVELLTGG